MNSTHQRWGEWRWDVVLGPEAKRPDFKTVQINAARFARVLFGTAAAMNIRELGGDWCIRVIAEGPPVHDPNYVQYIHDVWEKFLKNGFGADVHVHASVRLLAGSREDGAPAAQAMMLPSLKIQE